MRNDWRASRYWNDRTPPQSKAEFFNAVTTPAPSGDGTVATIRMYGPIDSWGGFWGISTKDVGQVLDALPESVEQIVLRINSPGGEVVEAVSILNMLRAHKAKVLAVVDGLAASAASFLAAGCDETVMSPGTQMMIHSPWAFALGNASELRKTADVLDGFESSIVDIYTDKAGVKDWARLLLDETWLTAADAVDLGLADRVAVIPDAGETETVGEPEVVTVDEPEDRTPLRLIAAARVAAEATPKPPVSTEPGEPNQRGVAMSDDFKAGLRERLGVTDAAASDETLLAALDEALAEHANTTPDPAPVAASVPEGAIVLDKGVHEQLVSDAQAGRKAMEIIDAQRRDDIVEAALRDGRIASASREVWRAQLDKDEDGTKALLESMPRNTVPVAEIGHAGEPQSVEDELMAKAGWSTTEEV